MEDLDRLTRDFGLAPRGKSNPMRSAADHRSIHEDSLLFTDPPKYTPTSKNSPLSDYDYDSMFRTSEPKYNYSGYSSSSSNNKAESSLPVYDKPVYDEDVPAARFNNDAFASISSPQSSKSGGQKSDFGDLFENLGRNKKVDENDRSSSAKSSSVSKGFDDLLPGFGSGASAASNRPTPESSQYSVPTAGSKHKNDPYDPFVVLEPSSTPGSSSSGVFTDSVDWMSKLGKSNSARAQASSGSGGVFDDLESLSTSGKPAGSFSPRTDNRGKNGSPSGSAMYQSDTTVEQKRNSSFRFSETNAEKKVPVDKFQDPPVFDMPNVSPQDYEPDPQINMFSTSGHGQQYDDVWLTVSEIPLFTQPTAAPPPSRPPPPLPRRNSRSETGSFSSSGKKGEDSFSTYDQHSQSPKSSRHVTKGPPVSQVDELENFGMGKSHNSVDERATFYPSEDTDGFSSAAASAAGLEDAMNKAQAKFRQAKEVRERENVKAARHKEPVQLGKGAQGWDEIESRETQERLEHERKQKEDEEREQRRLEREREIEREKGRHAVERASREARERAAAEAREKAAAETRRRSERAAVEKANAEARGRAERAAVQRAQAEARERAAAEAKVRAEKAAAEARDRAAAESRERVTAEAREREVQDKAAVARAEAEARRRAERAAVDRAAAEARGRAAAEARERAASATKMNHQKNDIDMEAFFSMGRASSAPRTRADSTDPLFDQRFPNSGGSEAAKRAPSSTVMKKASSTTNIVDDLSSLFGGTPSNGEFQEVEGEPEERRRARLDRHQRTQERTAKALAEKNQRDLQAQMDQEERHRISETLDFEIKRWAAGKEGNLRALLSTLQYVLWPECGWQAVSLTDLITGASVKKVYRKATLCIHPDKVQQKGASLQQKYIAEKVFDLLKEAWNKFNSEELF